MPRLPLATGSPVAPPLADWGHLVVGLSLAIGVVLVVCGFVAIAVALAPRPSINRPSSPVHSGRKPGGTSGGQR